MKVKFSIQQRAVYKIYFQWGGGCDLGVDLREIRSHWEVIP